MRCHCNAMSNITLAIQTSRGCIPSFRASLVQVLRCGTLQVSKFRVTAPTLIMIAAWSQYALAQESVPVQTALIAEIRESYEAGEGRQAQRLTPASVINQGDVVYYTVQIRNPAAVPAPSVAVIQRIPANTTYVLGSASGPSADITFSVDGGRTFAREKELVVVTPEGVSRPVTPADFTHIRWQLRNVLAPGAVALARFQAVFR
jgi:uncharacterized repeat protein (TIGR01451 family)